MLECPGLLELLEDFEGFACLCFRAGLLLGDLDLVVGAEELGRGGPDELVAILIEGLDKVMDFVPLDGVDKAAVAVWVKVVGPHKDLFLASRDCKGTDAGHDIADGIALGEALDQTAVLCVQSTVPVDLGVVETERAISFSDLDVHIVRSSEYFILERPILAFFANIIDFVNDCSYTWVLVDQNLANDVLVLQVMLSEIEMSCWSTLVLFVL